MSGAPKLTTSLLTRASRLAAKAQEMQSVLTDAFHERYGVSYSDVDCDSLIDALDYQGQESLTLAEADKLMTEAGHPPLPKERDL